jgi:hypothetical protein
MVRVEVLVPRTLEGLNDALAPVGNPLTLNVTVEEKDPRAETLTVYAALEFFATVRLLGETHIEKSTTMSFISVALVRVPLAALIQK